MYSLGIIVSSDRGFTGEYDDESGILIQEIMGDFNVETTKYIVLPDEQSVLEDEMIIMCDELQVDLLLTTGGTGFSPRDVIPEATIAVCDRMAMGIAEAMRYFSLQITKNAMLSRGVSGMRNKTIIVNMPGSPKAIRETLAYIAPALIHGIQMAQGEKH